MPSTAQSAQGTLCQIATGTGGAKNITAATQDNPIKVTSTAHGLVPGDVVSVAAVVGMTQLNGNSYVIQYVTTNTVTFANTNSVGYTAYTSGGTMTPVTYATLGNIRSFSGLDGQNSEIDTSNFQSTGKEFLLGLYDGGQMTYELDIDNADAAQQSARTAQQASTKKNFRVILPSGTTPTISFAGFVKKFSMQGGVDAPVRGQIVIRISGGYTLS